MGVDKGDLFLLAVAGGLFLVSLVFTEGGAFNQTRAEMAEADGPEIVDCLTATCLPVRFAADLVELFTFQGLPIVDWLQILLTILFLVPLLLGFLGLFL